jgi:hypothetical protein
VIRTTSSIGVKLLCLLYLLLAGQVAVCSQESTHDSGGSDTHELFCGGDCQNLSSVAIIAAPPAGELFPLVVGALPIIGLLPRPVHLPLESSRAPPLPGLA